MRQVQVSKRFSLEDLTPVEGGKIGRPAAGNVILQMKAVGLNYRDIMVATAFDRWRPPVGRVLCSDGVGVVVAVGEGVTRFSEGDLALTTLLPNWLSGPLTSEKRDGGLGGPAADGVLAEEVHIKADALVHAPTRLTSTEAAALPAAGVTAWHALNRANALRPDATVLVGGTGGVSLFAVQLALSAGARVIVTSSSDAKLERVRELGAFATLNYARQPHWADKVLDLTDGAGVDLAIDIGGAASLNESIRAVAINGVVSVVGLVGGLHATLNVAEIFQKNIRLDGIETGSRAMVEDLIVWIKEKGITPILDGIYPFDDSRKAFEHLSSGSPFGKICIDFG